MKKFYSMILFIVLVLTVSGCGKKADQELTIGIMPDVDSIPFIIAQEKGYFEEEGVNVVLESFQSPVDRDAALQTGNLDGAVSDILAVCFAKENNFEVTATSLTNGSYKLLVSPQSGITDMTELKDKSIAMSFNTIIEYSTDRILEEGGLSSADIEKVSIPKIPTRLEMLQNGKIDGATLPEPLASVAIAGGAKLLNSSNELNINPGILLFTDQAIEGKNKEISLLYKAYNKAVEYLQSHSPEEYFDVLIEKGGFPETIKDKLTLPTYHKAALPTKKDVEEVIQWLTEKDLIQNQYQYNDLVTDEFIEK